MNNSKLIEGINTAIQALDSTNISEVIRGLNFLLQKTYDANEISSSSNVIYLEQFPKLLVALGNLLDVINPLGKLPFQRYLGNQERNYYSFLLGSNDAMLANNSMKEWSTELPGKEIMEFNVSLSFYCVIFSPHFLFFSICFSFLPVISIRIKWSQRF
jgi:hypothetical protein